MRHEFVAPWPPSVNSWKTPFKNRMILTKRGREYRASLIVKMHEIGLYGCKMDGDLIVSLVLHPPTLRRYDIDNFCKSLFDGLTHAKFWNDDDQIVELNIKKGEKVKCGKIAVIVEQKQSEDVTKQR